MFTIVALVLATVVVGFLLPDRARIERSIVIERPPATVFAVLNGFRHFGHWSPWAKLDPDMQTTISGPMAGVGARYEWTSTQGAVGSGSQQIMASQPDEQIELRLEFSGMQASNLARYRLQREGEGTRLVWSFETEFGSSLTGRWFGLMLDRMLGPDYERGLVQLKAHVETLPAVDFSGIAVEVVEVPAQTVAALQGQSSTDPAAIARAYEKAYADINAALARERIKPSGPPLAIGLSWDAQAQRYAFEAAIPVPEFTRALRTARDIQIRRTYAGTALKSAHRGDQAEHLQQLMAWKQAVGWESNGAPWDVYVSVAERRIETYVPVK